MTRTARVLRIVTILFIAGASANFAFAQSGAWTTKASMPTQRWGLGAGVVNGIMYAIGGEQTYPAPQVATNQAYDPSTDSWTSKAPMLQARNFFGVGVVNNILYALEGGCPGAYCRYPYNGFDEAYNQSNDTWTEIVPPNTPTGFNPSYPPIFRAGPAAAVVNGIIYMFGGYNGFLLNTVEAYNPSTNTWTTETPMPTPRVYAAAAAVNGIIYIIGGGGATGALATVEAYDPSTNAWTTKTAMPTARSYVAAAAVNGIVHAVGGYSSISNSALAAVEAYNPSTDTWTTETPMPTARYALGLGVVNGILYAVGGFDTSGNTLTTNEAFSPEYSAATPAGSNVTLTLAGGATAPGGVSLTFSNVTTAGASTLETIPNPTPPPGFKLGKPPMYYEITTTAVFTGGIDVCINFTGVSFTKLSQLRLFHFQGGSWVNVTISLDLTNHIVCGLVSSLSPFSIFESELASADVAVIKVAPPFVQSGRNLIYGIGAVNLGPNPASSVVITDVLPAGTTFVSGVVGEASCLVVNERIAGCSIPSRPVPCISSGSTVSCTVGDLAQFTPPHLTGAVALIVVHVAATAGSTLTNTATVNAANPDPNMTNNSSTVTTRVW